MAKAIVALYRKAAADGLTISEAASRLGRNKSTVYRVAKKNSITFASGVIGRIPDYGAIDVRGNLYDSVKDACKGEGVVYSVIYKHLRNGTPERIGLMKHGGKR